MRVQKPDTALRRRRIERLRREIDLLEHMGSRLWRIAVVWAVLGIVAMALLGIAVAAKLDYFMYHPLAITVASAMVAVAAWWLGRYSLWIPVILVGLLLAILFEGSPDLGDWNTGGQGRDKPDRQRKLEAALAKRRSRLATLEERA